MPQYNDKQAFFDNHKAQKSQLLYQWIDADLITPVSCFLKLTDNNDYSFLLESVEGAKTLGRYSIIGYEPDVIWTVKSGKHTISGPCDSTQDAPLDALRDLLKQSKIHTNEDDKLPPMAFSGLFGFIGYDNIRLVEDIPDSNDDPLDLDDGTMMRPTMLAIFDNVTQRLCLVCPSYFNANKSPAASYQTAQNAIDTAHERLKKPLHSHPAIYQKSMVDQQQPPIPTTSPESYKQSVLRAKEYILAGDVFQVVPSQRFTMDFDLSSISYYRSLRRLNPSPFLFLVNLNGYSLIGSSPEILVRSRDNKITIRPIAGTRKRGKTHQEDMDLTKDLLADEKECAEHLMLLDLGRNDVGRVSQIGSVEVTDKFFVEYYSHVMHIVSNVQGELKEGCDAIDALMAGFPAGTVSGAPKVRAMEIIDELEPVKRKFYAGCVGYIAANGDMDTAIALRTALLKNGKLTIQAGAGVVADSDPQSEHEECVNKASALIRAAHDAIEQSHFNEQ